MLCLSSFIGTSLAPKPLDKQSWRSGVIIIDTEALMILLLSYHAQALDDNKLTS